MVAPWVLLKAPRPARPIGVRAVETMTASLMGLSSCFAASLADASGSVNPRTLDAAAPAGGECATVPQGRDIADA
jgi:hypothetical protein